jgi:3-deoxy-manno-octulosonate cytidylyltransferase (CMP-KDO synthetase)
MLKIVGVIPARYASTRLPGKPLLNIGDKSMIQLVYKQVKKCNSLFDVIVATDNELIFNNVIGFGGKAVMTSPNHQSGTDRCYEAIANLNYEADYVINIQGDEPYIQPEQIDLLVELLNGQTEIATLVKKIDDIETLFNENTPKVVLNKNLESVYFSRQTIPFLRGVDKANWLKYNVFYKHIGIYAYRMDILKALSKLEQTALEKAESLEQLRWLENGYKIKVAITPYDSIGIDTQADLDYANQLINLI